MNGARPAPGVVAAPSMAASDSRATTRAPRGHSSDSAVTRSPLSPLGQQRDGDGPPARQPAGEARVVRRRGQPTPDDVQQLIVVAGRAPDRRDRPGVPAGPRARRAAAARRRRRPGGPARSRPARCARRVRCGRRSPPGSPATARAAVRAARASSGSNPSRSPRRSGSDRTAVDAAGLGDLDGGQRSERQLGRRRRPRRRSASTGRSGCRSGRRRRRATMAAAIRQPRSRASRSRAAAASKSIAGDDRDHLPGGGRLGEVLEPGQPPGADARRPTASALAGRAIAVRSSASSSMRPSSSRSVCTG